MLVIDLRPEVDGPVLGSDEADVVTLAEAALRAERGVAVGVYPCGDADRARELSAWARETRVPLLAVAIGDGFASVGPLVVPGAGCACCAGERMRAAADAGPERAPAVLDGGARARLAARVREAVLDETQRIELDGTGASRLLDRVLLLDGDRPATRHRFVPLADCPLCAGERSARSEPARLEADEADSPLPGWVDAVTGVIPGLALEQPLAPEDPPLYVIGTAEPRVPTKDGRLRRLPSGWGKGLSLVAAARSAIGEAIERYSASLPDVSRLVWLTSADLEGDRIEPASFPLYSDAQYGRAGFPYPRPDPAVRHPWVRGRWLDTGAEVWVPAVLVFLSLEVEPGNAFCQGTSSGLAASTEFDDATLRATLELVERDAVLAAWATGAAGRRVELDRTIGSELLAVVAALESLGGSVEVYLLPTSLVGTTAVALAFGDGVEWPGATLGVACDFDPQAAIAAAILELGQAGPYLRRLLRAGVRRVPRDDAEVVELVDHATYYFPAERAGAFAHLRAGEGTVTASTLPAESAVSLEEAARRLAAAGARVAAVDVTAADVARSPLTVVRAVSADLQPLSYGYGLDRLPVARIRGDVAPGRVPIHPVW